MSTTNKNFEVNEDLFRKEYLDPIIFNGRMTTLVAALLSCLPMLYLWLGLGYKPSWSFILQGWLNIVVVYFAIYIVEPLSYFPMLGISGIYIGYLAGNVPSVRLPALLAAQAATNSKAGSRRGDLVGTIAMGSSVFVNIVFVTLAALIGDVVLKFLPVFITNAFDYTLPAVLGAIMGQFLLKNPPFIIIILSINASIYALPIKNALQFPIAILISGVLGYLFYKRAKKRGEAFD